MQRNEMTTQSETIATGSLPDDGDALNETTTQSGAVDAGSLADDGNALNETTAQSDVVAVERHPDNAKVLPGNLESEQKNVLSGETMSSTILHSMVNPLQQLLHNISESSAATFKEGQQLPNEANTDTITEADHLSPNPPGVSNMQATIMSISQEVDLSHEQTLQDASIVHGNISEEKRETDHNDEISSSETEDETPKEVQQENMTEQDDYFLHRETKSKIRSENEIEELENTSTAPNSDGVGDQDDDNEIEIDDEDDLEESVAQSNDDRSLHNDELSEMDVQESIDENEEQKSEMDVEHSNEESSDEDDEESNNAYEPLSVMDFTAQNLTFRSGKFYVKGTCFKMSININDFCQMFL